MQYFAYGSNCSPAIMRRKGVQYESADPAVLDGYRLQFNKRALRVHLPPGIGYANIEPDRTSCVEGILYLISDGSVDRLDASERYPDHYTRIEVTVQTKLDLVICQSYQAQPDKTLAGLRPTRGYLNHLLTATRSFSRDYVRALEQVSTFVEECKACRIVAEVVFCQQGDQTLMLCRDCEQEMAREDAGNVRE